MRGKREKIAQSFSRAVHLLFYRYSLWLVGFSIAWLDHCWSHCNFEKGSILRTMFAARHRIDINLFYSSRGNSWLLLVMHKVSMSQCENTC